MKSLHSKTPLGRKAFGSSLAILTAALATAGGIGVASASPETVTFTAQQKISQDGQYAAWPYGDPNAKQAEVFSYQFGSEQSCNDVRTEIRNNPELADLVWPAYLVPTEAQDTPEYKGEAQKYPTFSMYPDFVNSSATAYRSETGTCNTISKVMPEGASADDPTSYLVPVAWEFTSAVPTFAITRE